MIVGLDNIGKFMVKIEYSNGGSIPLTQGE